MFANSPEAQMSVTSVLVAVVPFVVIGLELYSGCAVIGWTGDRMVVERRKSPGPYWFSIALHTVIAMFLASVMVAANL